MNKEENLLSSWIISSSLWTEDGKSKRRIHAILHSSPYSVGIFTLICLWDVVMCCGKSFISSGVFLHKIDSWHYTGCLHFSLLSFLLCSRSYSFLSRTLLSLILVSYWRRETYAHLGKISCLPVILNMHTFSHSTKLLFLSLLHFLNPALLLHAHTHTRKYAFTPLGTNHCKQQIVVNASPRSACCCVVKRKKRKKIWALWYF